MSVDNAHDENRLALPECARDFGLHYLPGQPFVLSDVGFARSLGSYDYSLRAMRFDGVLSRFDYEQGEFKEGSWNDIRNAAWLRASIEFATICLQFLPESRSQLTAGYGQVAHAQGF